MNYHHRRSRVEEVGSKMAEAIGTMKKARHFKGDGRAMKKKKH
jgi:hypothetical protein